MPDRGFEPTAAARSGVVSCSLLHLSLHSLHVMLTGERPLDYSRIYKDYVFLNI